MRDRGKTALKVFSHKQVSLVLWPHDVNENIRQSLCFFGSDLCSHIKDILFIIALSFQRIVRPGQPTWLFVCKYCPRSPSFLSAGARGFQTDSLALSSLLYTCPMFGNFLLCINEERAVISARTRKQVPETFHLSPLNLFRVKRTEWCILYLGWTTIVFQFILTLSGRKKKDKKPKPQAL